MENKLIIGEDNICPVTKLSCDDECCSPGAECNLSGDEVKDMIPDGYGRECWSKIPDGWTSPDVQLPDIIDNKVKPVLVQTEGRRILIAHYFPDRFRTVEWEDWDDYCEENYSYTEDDKENQCVWLRAGWYYSTECDRCESYWNEPLKVMYWQYLPETRKG